MRLWFLARFCLIAMAFASVDSNTFAQSGSDHHLTANRLTHLDSFCDPYYPHQHLARLTTPQWIGEEGVDAVITLGIDDMRDPAKYEAYLRPLLDRLKKIDGRAPVSIMTCTVDPNHPQLQSWLEEGLSLECHTVDHPCPCLQGGSFERAKDTYDRCVDLMASINKSRPVAFRFPCMDSLNTPSPRAFAEIVNQRTASGNFLQISTSVTCLLTPQDSSILKHFRTPSEQGADSKNGSRIDANRFKKYVPFPSFVNQIRNYPYPYLIGNQCWEFPCTIPDDWQGQNINRPNNPKTVEDLKAAIDATVTKKGVANIIFHPHGWIRAEQLVEVIDHVEKTYGKRVKFLNFRECLDRMNRHLLDGVPVREATSGKNPGVRILDINGDGYQDVIIGTANKKKYRLWNPDSNSWDEFSHNLFVNQTRFGVHQSSVVALQQSEKGKFDCWSFSPNGRQLTRSSTALSLDKKTTIEHIRLRDLDGNGTLEIVVAAPHEKKWISLEGKAEARTYPVSGEFPLAIATEEGKDNGLRFVDLNEDLHDDLILSNDRKSAVYLFDNTRQTFRPVELNTELPRIVSQGKNGGVWFANGHLWVQNEHTNRLPDGVDRRSFQNILAKADPAPKSSAAALKSFHLSDEFKIELMAAEPLVQDPVAMEWGLDGKLWVVEMADYPLGIDDRGKPGGRVRYLEDTNGDGKYDQSTLFVDGIPFPTGVLPTNLDPAKPSCLITAAPYLVQASEKSSWNQVISDRKNILLRGFAEGNQQHRFNGFSPGLDNWLYLANGDSGGVVESAEGNKLNIRGLDLRIRLGKTLRMEAQAGQTQFGRHRDDWGNWFGCSNPIPLRQYLLPDHYLKRNPHFTYPPSHIDIATAGNTQVFPKARVLSHWSGYRPPKPGEPHRFTSACSTDFYRGKLFDDSFFGNTFTCEPVHNLVHRRTVQSDGLTFRSSRPESERQSEFLASSDSWFRPTTVKTGPDGALWVCDMYRLIIEHPEWIDDQREKQLFLRAGHDRGRIYRIVPVGRHPRSLPSSRPTGATPQKSNVYNLQLAQQLTRMLTIENRWQQETAQRFLVQFSNQLPRKQVHQDLLQLLNHAQPLTRLVALCTLDGRDEITANQVATLINDEHPGVRKHAIRIAEKLMADPSSALLAALKTRVNDSDIQVRIQLAFSLGFCSHPEATETLAKLGIRHVNNPYVRAAVVSSLNPSNVAKVVRQTREKQNASEFLMIALEQASRMGHTNLARESLLQIFQRDDINKIRTRELELVVQIFSSMMNKPVDTELAQLSKDFIEQLLPSIHDSDSPRRTKAILQLVARSPFTTISKRAEILLQQVNLKFGVERQRMAIAELAALDTPSVPRSLIKYWRQSTPSIREALLETLTQRPEWTRQFLEAIRQDIVPASEISPDQRTKLVRLNQEQNAQLARELFEIDSSAPTDAGLARYLDKFANSTKDPSQLDIQQGKSLFEKHCSTCHQLDSIGNAIGPDLLALKDHSKGALIKAILQPNLAVEDKYRSYVVQLKDGRELAGLIAGETSTQLNLATSQGKKIQIARDDVERIKSTGKSLMPTGFENDIPPEKMMQLIAYLERSLSRSSSSQKSLSQKSLSGKTMRQPRKTFDGNQPEIVKCDAEKRFELLASQAEIYGPQAVFETKYANVGFWGNVDDWVRWRVLVDNPGRFEVFMTYACPDDTAGNRFQMMIGNRSLEQKVKGTKSWDNYRRTSLGQMDVKSGVQMVTVTAQSPLRGFLFDLKSIELVPVKKQETPEPNRR